MNFSVGQVIYLLTKKDPKVYPALVCEEVQKRSLTGNTTSYVVRLPTDDAKEVELERLDAEIFTGIDEARSTMISKATEKIDFILSRAEEISHVFSEFAVSENSDESEPEEVIESEESQDQEYATVDLGGGQVARINVNDISKIRGE
tara:strand:- start:1882 stop:2322 length:441 start_codon:yes stop_codon:yes gene_type:complete